MHPNDIRRLAAAAITVSALCALRPGKAEQHITCPMTVDAKQVSVDAPAGWTGVFGPAGTMQLQAAQAIFTAGSLHEPWGELRDPPTVKTHGMLQTTYPLPPAPELKKWIICHYGDRVYQAMRLPDTTEQCLVSYRQVSSGKKQADYVVSDITCGKALAPRK